MWVLSGLTVTPVGCEPAGRVSAAPEILLVDVAILVTAAGPPFATYSTLPLELIAVAVGSVTAIVVTTALVAVLITVTVLPVELDTYSRLPSGLIVRPSGDAPTEMVPTTVSF